MESLLGALEVALSEPLSQKTLQALRVAFDRLRPEHVEELSQEIIIECWSRKGIRQLADIDVRRAVWRARQKIHRSRMRSRRYIHLGIDPQDHHNDIANFDTRNDFEDIMNCLKESLEELDLIFLEYCRKGLSVNEIAELHKLSVATVYRRIATIRSVIHKIME